MRTSPKIGHSHTEQMNLIHEFVCRFDVQLLLYAINGRRLDEEQIVSITNDISEYLVKLKRQKEHLFRFNKTFNKHWATEDNGCFDSSIKQSRRIRSGLAGIKKVFMMFCKPSRKPLPVGMSTPQAYERSLISTPHYSADLYGLESYPPCVTELFRVMLEFYDLLDDCIAECKRALAEEKEKKSDPDQTWELLIADCEQSKRQQFLIIEAMDQDPALKKALMESKHIMSDNANPVLKEYKRARMEQREKTFAQDWFHRASPQDVDRITLVKAFSEADEDPNLMMAMALFGKEKQRILRINYAIDHYDELLPEKCKRGVIPALHLYFFMEWCNPLLGVESFLNYFNKRYKELGGKWKVIGVSALNGAKSKYNNERVKSVIEIYEKTKEDMRANLEEMLSAVTFQEKTA